MVLSRLLGTVVGLAAGVLDKKSEGCEKRGGIDMRTGGRRRKEFCVFAEEAGHGFVVALAEEVGFADGLVGERAVEREGGRCEEKGGGEKRSDGASGSAKHDGGLQLEYRTVRVNGAFQTCINRSPLHARKRMIKSDHVTEAASSGD